MSLQEKVRALMDEILIEQEDNGGSDEAKSKEVIKSLGTKSYKSEKNQHAAAEMITGLAASNTDISNKFFALLDDALNDIAKELGVTGGE